MSLGEERVSALLSVITESGVDVNKLSKLRSYRRLVKLHRREKTCTASRVKENVRTDTQERDPARKRNGFGKKENKPKNLEVKQVSDNLTDESADESEDEVQRIHSRGCKSFCERHRAACGASASRSVLSWVAGFFIGLIFFYIHQHELLTHQGFSRFWLNWENVGLQAEVCTIDLPDRFQDIFRPIVDCSMCHNVTHVEKVSKLSPELFEQRYAYTGRPVLILDGQEDWSAPQTFSFDFFKNIYATDSPVLSHSYRDCQFFPYQTNFKNLRDVFNMSRERVNLKGEPWYIGWSNCDSAAANELRQHYSRPYFLPAASEASKMDWIFMGTPGYGAHLHIDHVGKPSWQAQIRGSKTWTLEPPPECYFQCQPLAVTVHPGNISERGRGSNYTRAGHERLVPQDADRVGGAEHHHRLRIRLRRAHLLGDWDSWSRASVGVGHLVPQWGWDS